MSEIFDIVERVVVRDDSVLLVRQRPLVEHHLVPPILVAVFLGIENSTDGTPTYGVKAGTVLSTDSVALKENGTLVAEIHAFDVDGVARYGNSVPATAHRPVGAAPRLAEPQLLFLHERWRDGRFLVNRSNLCACSDGVVEDLVFVSSRDLHDRS